VLTNLSLYGNGIGEEGAKALASALRVNGVLKTLNLYGNNIRDEGAAAIAEALRVNGVLNNIDLRYNDLGDEGNDSCGERAGRVQAQHVRFKLNKNSISVVWAKCRFPGGDECTRS